MDAMRKRRVTYFYEPTIDDYYYGQGHPMKPHRICIAHSLVVHYDLRRHHLHCCCNRRHHCRGSGSGGATTGDDDGNFSELYVFKWTILLIPPTTVLVLNIVGIVAGVSYAVNNGYQSWGLLVEKLFFAIWVIVHLYPFLKGLLGRQNRTPTIIIVWSILLASIFFLLWV